MRTPNPDLNNRLIDLASWPTHVDATGQIHFEDNGSPEYNRIKDEIIRPDSLILATGYRHEMPFFFDQDALAAAAAAKNQGGNLAPDERPYPRPAAAKVRHIWAPDDPTVAFIGFLRPIGAIPPVAEM